MKTKTKQLINSGSCYDFILFTLKEFIESDNTVMKANASHLFLLAEEDRIVYIGETIYKENLIEELKNSILITHVYWKQTNEYLESSNISADLILTLKSKEIWYLDNRLKLAYSSFSSNSKSY